MSNGSNAPNIFNSFTSGVVKWIGWQVASFIGPVVIGIVTAWAGRLGDGSSWMWSIMAGSLAYGGSAAGIYFTLAIVARQRVNGRLELICPQAAIDINTGDIVLGVQLRNSAENSIEFEIVHMATELGGNYPAKKPYSKTVFEIPAGGKGWFHDYSIQVARGNPASVCSGSVVAEIKYGRPGYRKYVMNVKCAMHIRFDANGNLEATAWEETV